MWAKWTGAENIQVLEIQEFHLPTFALKMLHALKVLAKIRLLEERTKGLERSQTHAQIQSKGDVNATHFNHSATRSYILNSNMNCVYRQHCCKFYIVGLHSWIYLH